MVTKRKSPALFTKESAEVETKYSGIQKRHDALESDDKKHSHQQVSNALKLKLDHLKTFEPLTENQAKFFRSYKDGDYFIGMFGSAGTGKTFCSMYRAIEEVMDKTNSFKRVVIVRSCVQTRDVGFLPGSLEEKGEIYELPYKEIATTLFDRPDAWDRLKEQQYARFISTTAIRGISIDDAIVIVDECQNMSFQELNTIITRVGYRSKIIFVGDWKQNDLVKSKYDTSGLPEFLNVARKMKEFTEFEFTRDDIVRSSLVKSWVIACEESGV
jgi:phosphate starvation-inducible protein PhoH and related proteins